MLEELAGERRAARVRINGEERWIDAADAGLYRDALGCGAAGRAAGGVPRGRARRAARLVRRFAATHGPFTTADVRPATASTPRRRCASWSATASLVRGELRPGGSEREWCDPDVLRRLRRASLAVLRKEIEPAEQRELARFLPGWQGVDATRRRAPGLDRLRETLVPLQGLALPAEVWERDVLPRRLGAYSPVVDGPALRQRRAGLDRRRRAGAQLGSRRPLLPRGPRAARAAAVPRRAAVRRRARGGPRAAGRRGLLLHRPARRRRAVTARRSRKRSGISPGRAWRPTTPSRRCARRG